VLNSKRVRKKKRLTDPVSIIPFPEQLLKDVIVKNTVSKTSTPPPVSSLNKVEAKVLNVPSGQLNTSNLSIKKILEPAKEISEKGILLNKEEPFEKFSFDQVKMVWRRYAHEVKSKGMETFYNAMIKRDPKIKDEVFFTMDVDNQVQIDYITPHVNDLVGFLRRELKNFNITLDFILSSDQESQVKFLTGKDRFESMAKKNLNLHTFKKIFNLDIEF
jgi:DNA polymerase-3 subunit gamma/tau